MKTETEPLNQTQVLLRIAQAILDSTTPAKGSNTDWGKVSKLCPKCGETKKVDPDFGTVNKRGVIRAQSWCKHCRATTNYYDSPRVNDSKNRKR